MGLPSLVKFERNLLSKIGIQAYLKRRDDISRKFATAKADAALRVPVTMQRGNKEKRHDWSRRLHAISKVLAELSTDSVDASPAPQLQTPHDSTN